MVVFRELIFRIQVRTSSYFPTRRAHILVPRHEAYPYREISVKIRCSKTSVYTASGNFQNSGIFIVKVRRKAKSKLAITICYTFPQEVFKEDQCCTVSKCYKFHCYNSFLLSENLIWFEIFQTYTLSMANLSHEFIPSFLKIVQLNAYSQS